MTPSVDPETRRNQLGSSLRSRIAVLAVLVALLSTTIAVLMATAAVRRGITGFRTADATGAAIDVRRQLDRYLIQLEAEVQRQAGLMSALLPAERQNPQDELGEGFEWDQSLAGIVEWITVSDTAVRVHVRGAHIMDEVPDPREAETTRLLKTLAARAPCVGFATFGRKQVMLAARQMPGDAGPVATLIGVSPMNQALRNRFRIADWLLRWEVTEEPVRETIRLGYDAQGLMQGDIVIDSLAGRRLALTVTENEERGAEVTRGAYQALVIGGMMSVILATALGVLLGWHWVRPLSRLAEACRRRIDDATMSLPAASGLMEAEVLTDSLRDLVAAELVQREALAEALNRETTANAVHQRFLAQLAQEIGAPVHAILGAIDRLHAGGGSLPPEEAAAVRDQALALEERLQEVLGLAVELEPSGGAGERAIDHYLAGVADQLRHLAERRGMKIQVEGSGGRLRIDPGLLTPILVNLASNALAAGTPGHRVILRGRVSEAGGSHWEVEDEGPGIPVEVAATLMQACDRGEVLPGAPGIGLGYAVILANARALKGRIVLRHTGPAGTLVALELPDLSSGSGTRIWHKPSERYRIPKA